MLETEQTAKRFIDILLHVAGIGLDSGREFHTAAEYKVVGEWLMKHDRVKPINTSKALKCKGHPVGATGTSQRDERWKNLRGEGE